MGLYFVCLVCLGNLKIGRKIIFCYDDGFGKYGFIRNNFIFGLLFVCILGMLGCNGCMLFWILVIWLVEL